MGVLFATQKPTAQPTGVIAGRRRWLFQSTAKPIVHDVVLDPPVDPPALIDTFTTHAPGGMIEGRRRWPYQPSAHSLFQHTPTSPGTDYNRILPLPGLIVSGRRFVYTGLAMPVLPQVGEVSYTGADQSWTPTCPALHLRRAMPWHLLLRTRPDTPWDIDVVPPLWMPTYPDLHWRLPRDTRPFAASGVTTPEPDIAPVHWLPTYPDLHFPKRALLAAQQDAYRDFLDTPPSFTPGSMPWFMPLSVPPAVYRALSRLHLDPATFDRDMTQGGDPSPTIDGEVWRRRNMVSPIGQILRAIIPGSN